MLTRYVLPALSALAFTFAVLQMTKAQQKPPTAAPPVDPGRSPFGRQVAGAGIVEPETENIAVGAHLPGVVKSVSVRVGDVIPADAPLFELDARQLAAEATVRRAALVSAKASHQKLLDTPRQEELPPLRAKLAEAEANLADKQWLFSVVKEEQARGTGFKELFGTRQQAVKVAEAQVARADADLKLAAKGAWEPDREVARQAVAQAAALLAQTETELGRLNVLAPRVRKPSLPRLPGPVSDADAVGFQVLQVNVRPGEFVSAAPGAGLIVLGHVGNLHVRVDIDENDIGRLAKVDVPGVANPRGNPAVKLPLAFVRVEPYVIPKKSLTGGNTERVDTRVLQVIYRIDAPNPGLYVGQQVDVSLDTGGK